MRSIFFCPTPRRYLSSGSSHPQTGQQPTATVHWRLITQQGWGEKQRLIHLCQGEWTAPLHSGWQWHLSQGGHDTTQGRVLPAPSYSPQATVQQPHLTPLVGPHFALLSSNNREARLTCSHVSEEATIELISGSRRLTTCYQSWPTDWRKLGKLQMTRNISLVLIYLALVLKHYKNQHIRDNTWIICMMGHLWWWLIGCDL